MTGRGRKTLEPTLFVERWCEEPEWKLIGFLYRSRVIVIDRGSAGEFYPDDDGFLSRTKDA